MGYLVKWRGYADQHNSWVDETDAAFVFYPWPHALVLILFHTEMHKT